MNWRVLYGVFLFAATVAVLTGCAVEANDGKAYKLSDFKNPNAQGGAGGEGGQDATGGAVEESTECHPPEVGEQLPARTVTHLGAESPRKRRVFVNDLFDQFRSLCGGCHVDGNQGNWQITRKTFNLKAARESLLAMSDDRSLIKVMPPGSVGGKLPQDRTAEDPAVQLIEMLRSYIKASEAGPQYDSYEEAISSIGDSSQYRMEPEVASAMTQLGNCIPDKGLYAVNAEEMKALDAKFAQMAPKYTGTLVEQIGLPADLKDTDLITFDSRELAKRGVVAWTPNYPVYIDGARSIRHVRVPFGTSITFDKETQQFVIPDLTRFYKTFLKPVVEIDGSLHWRKVETQLIVVWQDDETYGTGYRAVMSLYGTYAWNDDETEAKLVTNPLRDGKAWRDHILTYTSDEVTEASILEQAIADEIPDPAFRLLDGGAVHHFAIPGSRRCVECHQGSTSKNFVLGFQPLQIKRRKAGEGGVQDTEGAGADELTQIKRFLNYGLIKGLESENDIVNLEDSQGSRKPRNDYELKAQGYMIGVCANCHNDRGSATEYNPKLKGLLDLQPGSGSTGGIFQFPLDRYSESIFRGGSEHVPVPYITPSLFDRPSTLTDGGIWRSKCTNLDSFDVPGLDGKTAYIWGKNCSLAPWRSLIYRGVATPFAYSDDLALFPRMPMHAPGFDCRSPRILAEWMTSIPALLPQEQREFESLIEVAGNALPDGFPGPPPFSPQPYVEVKPGDAMYAAAVAQAETQLKNYRGEIIPNYGGSNQFTFCPGHNDIFDSSVLKDSIKTPVPVDKYESVDGVSYALDNVPNNVHWVIQDATLIPGDWSPRRADWRTVLQEKHYTSGTTEHEKLVIDVLQNVTLTDDLQYFAYKKRPMTIWNKKATCNFSGEPTVAFYASNKPLWMSNKNLGDAEPVYQLSPGEYVNDLVCAHCHGSKGDSTGREANTLLEMTGGNARVTNFIKGISVASNRARVFGGVGSGSADDWASRYFAWMGLGGTRTTIPSSIISIVATNDSLGERRGNYAPPKDANMLSAPEDFCKWTLPWDTRVEGSSGRATSSLSISSKDLRILRLSPDRSPLIRSNGDEEMWHQLCALNNPRPVRAMHLEITKDTSTGTVKKSEWVFIANECSLYNSSNYPKTAPVMDHRGNVTFGVQDSNLSPWCLRKPATEEGLSFADKWRQDYPTADKQLIPYCPVCVPCSVGSSCPKTEVCEAGTQPYIPPFDVDISSHSKAEGDVPLNADDVSRWAVRGAVNAGLVAFEHLKTIAESASVTITPRYDECEKLTQ